MFKYLKEIFVHYNYVDRNFLINFDKADSEGDKPFRHLIITGKNGSGKTKVLEALNEEMSNVICGRKELLTQNTYGYTKNEYPEFSYPRVSVEFYEEFKKAIKNSNFVYAYLGTDRSFEVKLEKNGSFVDVLEKAKQDYKTQIHNYNSALSDKPSGGAQVQIIRLPIEIIKPTFKPSLSKYFLQYLFGKKDQQVYAIGDEEHEKAQALTQWFKDINKQFKFIFENDDIELKHKRISSEERKFYFELPDGRTFDFSQLSHGYNNVFAIVAEIWLHIEAYQVKYPDDHNPRGLVIIDELETHLHLSLQEKILPFLTGLFPNIQFIIATHSPVIMASETNCVIFDLDEKYTEKDNIMGYPYQLIMKEHLGLGSEYSLAITKDLNRARDLIQTKDRNEKQEKELKILARKLGDLSPTLALDVLLAIEKYAEAE